MQQRSKQQERNGTEQQRCLLVLYQQKNEDPTPGEKRGRYDKKNKEEITASKKKKATKKKVTTTTATIDTVTTITDSESDVTRSVSSNKEYTSNVPILTNSVVYLGAQRLIKAIANMPQAIHTRTPVSTDHFCFDSNPEGTTANKLIHKLRHNNGNGQYGTCLLSIDKELNVTCSFAKTIIGACGEADIQLIPLSEMVVYCRTNKLYRFVPFFESVETQIRFVIVNAIVQLVPKLTAVVKGGTPNADRNIMKQVLQEFFPGFGENNNYKPTKENLDGRDKVSASMVSASIYLPNGKMNIVCHQMYHN